MTSSNYSEKTCKNAVQKLFEKHGLELCLRLWGSHKPHWDMLLHWNMLVLKARSLDTALQYDIWIEHEDGRVTNLVKDYGEGKWHSIAHALARCRRCTLSNIYQLEEIDIKMPHSIDEIVVLGDLA